jgi:methylmalonyl-CoA/ethylmalonyl-CoA epimerase
VRDDSVLSARLLSKGPGLHHVTFIVSDVEDTDARLRAHGYATTGLDVSSSGWSETFIRHLVTGEEGRPEVDHQFGGGGHRLTR